MGRRNREGLMQEKHKQQPPCSSMQSQSSSVMSAEETMANQCRKGRTHRRRRRQRSGCPIFFVAAAAAAATTLVLTIRPLVAFQTPFPPPPATNGNKPYQHRSRLHSSTVSVQGADIRMAQRPAADSSILFALNEYEDSEREPRPSVPTDGELRPPTAVKRFKSINKTSNYPSTRKRRSKIGSTTGENVVVLKTNKSTPSRSSTMPGFAGRSDRQRAYRDGIRLVERRSGRRILENEAPELRRQRRKENGDAMYRNSASVPDSLVQFADEIHHEDRITRNEEIELGEKTQEALRLQTLYDSLEVRLEREPTDEEWCAAAGKINMEAIRQAIEDGLEAKNKLVTSNLRMVQSVVNTYIRNGLSGRYNAGDMMQEGIIALIRAAEKFEPDRGWKFSTYAMYWVRASVKRSQIYQSRIIPVPQRLFENHKRLLRTEQELIQVLGRKPTRLELGEAVGMSETQVTRCFDAMNQQCLSLDQGISNALKPNSGDREGNTLIEIVETRTDDGDYARQNQMQVREALVETLNKHLEPDQVELLMLRFGLTSGEQLSIAELSRIVGLKPDNVRRRIGTCLQRLRAIGVEEWLAFERDLQ